MFTRYQLSISFQFPSKIVSPVVQFFPHICIIFYILLNSWTCYIVLNVYEIFVAWCIYKQTTINRICSRNDWYPRRQWLRGKQKVARVKFEHQPLENDAVSVVSKAASSLRNHQPKILSESIHLTGNIIWYFLWDCGRVVLAIVENVLGINI